MENRTPFYSFGVDIDANDLYHASIVDLVTITNGYGKTFGRPPD